MSVRGDRTAVLEALASVRETMQLDGYRLDVNGASAERLDLEIVALDDACEECLAPAMVLKMMVSTDLSEAYAPEEIDVVMPAVGAH